MPKGGSRPGAGRPPGQRNKPNHSAGRPVRIVRLSKSAAQELRILASARLGSAGVDACERMVTALIHQAWEEYDPPPGSVMQPPSAAGRKPGQMQSERATQAATLAAQRPAGGQAGEGEE